MLEQEAIKRWIIEKRYTLNKDYWEDLKIPVSWKSHEIKDGKKIDLAPKI